MSANRKTVCCMASFPKRKEAMLYVIRKLLPKCDTFCLYLNEYERIPAELIELQTSTNKLEIILGERNLLENGRLMFVDKHKDAYYLTVDDDIDYPDDYVQKMKESIDCYCGNAIITYHGKKLCRKPHCYYMFFNMLEKDTFVNSNGCGVTGFIPSNVGFSRPSVDELVEIDGDLILAIFAQKNGVDIVCRKHEKGWLKTLVLDGIEYQNVDGLKNRKMTKIKRKLNQKIYLGERWKKV